MPGKNLKKEYVADSYYHIYNRGVNKRKIFYDDDDYRVFLNLLKRYLGEQTQLDIKKREYPNYSKEVELVAYCLMPNHYHLLVYVSDNPELLRSVMGSIITSYVRYFNKRHKRIGSLFGKQYRAVRIDNDSQLWHITRYIHLNPVDLKETNYKEYEYSSIGYYLGYKSSDWLKPNRILFMFKESNQDYHTFLEEYLSKRNELKRLSKDLY